MKRFILLLAGLLGACASATQQPAFQRDINPFPVLDEHGRAYEHALVGGFDVPRPQFVDIDADGDLDLFVQERSNELMFFENVGTAGAPRFRWRTDRFQNLAIGEWNRFVDLDHDGDMDLLAEEPFSYIRFYRNEGSRTAPRFVLAADSLRDEAGKPIFADRQNIPNLVDVDCDGLLDLFLGRVEGTLTRLEQIDGKPAVPRFRWVTDRFEGIEIVAQVGSMKHGANTMYWADPDNDGDHDLYWGDFFEPGVLFIQNVAANCQVPSLRVEPVPITVNGEKLTTSGYNVPVLVDIDADGTLEMFVGVLGGAYNPHLTSAENFFFLERGANGLELQTKRFIYGVDVGTESVPAFGDLDGDGDLDLLIGNKLDPRRPGTGRIYHFRNDGTRTRPSFRLADTLDLVTAFHQAPALGDLDGDGDLDMLLGTWNDGVLFFRNTGTARQPQWQQDTAATIRFSRGSNFTPVLADIDADGDLDVLVGEASGELNLVRNTGIPTRPHLVVEDENFQRIDVGRRAAFGAGDIDGDGDIDLFAGSETAGSQFFRNQGSARAPAFVKQDAFSLPFHHLATPTLVDIDGDGDLDIFTGSLGGGIIFWLHR